MSTITSLCRQIRHTPTPRRDFSVVAEARSLLDHIESVRSTGEISEELAKDLQSVLAVYLLQDTAVSDLINGYFGSIDLFAAKVDQQIRQMTALLKEAQK